MHTFQLALTALAAALILQEPFDYSKVDRKIASEPKYAAAPRYALLLVGTEGKTRLWMAMDKSKADADQYDVLYLDRDGDGNLGEDGERVAAPVNERGGIDFRLGKVEIPEAKVLLENLQVTSYPHEKKQLMFFSFKMDGKVTMYGAYGPNGTYLHFAESRDKAPILHAAPSGTLSFLHMGPEEMKIGDEDTVMLYVGARGSGPATFLAVDEHFLDLDKDKIFVTLVARDAKGKEIRQRTQLKEHC
jgi:hypothetical protein